ncbi:MAG: hypothetical protein AB9883_00905 [Acidaminococcaceae bacterium]
MLLLKKSDLKGIKATGFSGKHLGVKLEGNVLIVFYNIPESVHQKLLLSKEPLEYLNYLKTRFRCEDYGPIVVGG